MVKLLHPRFSILLIFSMVGLLPLSLHSEESGTTDETVVLPDLLTLEDAVDLALQSNLDLQIQRVLTEEARLDLDIARAEFDPNFSGSTTTSARTSPGSSSQLDGSPQPESRRSSIDAAVEQPLPSGGTVSVRSDILDRNKTNSSFRTLNPEFNSSLRLQVRQPLLRNAGFRYNLSPLELARLSIAQSDQEQFGELLSLLRETEANYWDVVASEAERDITERSIRFFEFLIERAQELFEADLAIYTDVLEAEATLAEREELLLSTSAAVETSRDQLFLTLGLLKTHEPGSIQLEELPDRVLLDPEPDASYKRAVKNSPALEVARLTTARREEEVARQENQLKPQIDLVGSTGVLGQNGSFSSAQSSLRDADGTFWDLGFEVRIPWGRRAEKAQLMKARYSLQRAELAAENAELDIYASVRAACRRVELAHKRLDATAVTLQLAERRLEAQQERYEGGQITIRDVLEAQTDLDAARFRLLQARVQEIDSIVELAEIEGTLPSRYGLESLGTSNIELPTSNLKVED